MSFALWTMACDTPWNDRGKRLAALPVAKRPARMLAQSTGGLALRLRSRRALSSNPQSTTYKLTLANTNPTRLNQQKSGWF